MNTCTDSEEPFPPTAGATVDTPHGQEWVCDGCMEKRWDRAQS